MRPERGRTPILTWSDDEPPPPDARGAVVALVPARNSGRVGETVQALVATGDLDAVVVIDDGSTDDTATRAAAAGALVVSTPVNLGKGDAIRVGRSVAPNAEVYLLVDADLGESAVAVTRLLDPVRSDRADLSVAVFPPAAGRGGFGIIKRGSARIIAFLCGAEVREPLSGQRAVRGDLFRALPLAARFGLEVGMTVDAVRAGARLVEIDLPLDHEHTGRTVGGFRHRARQGLDIARAVVPRLGGPVARRGVIGALAALVLLVALWCGDGAVAPRAFRSDDRPVIVVTVAHASLTDLDDGVLPEMARLAGRAGGAMAPRTPSLASDQASGYATVGAGAPVVLVPPGSGDLELEETAGLLELDDETLGAGPFVAITGGASDLRVSAPVVPSSDSRSYGEVGSLGDALAGAGVTTAYVGARSGGSGGHAPAALVVADHEGRIGHFYPGSLPLAPGGDLDARVGERVATVRDAIASAGVVVVDTGGAPVARAPGAPPLEDAELASREARRRGQMEVADRFIGALAAAKLDARILVVGLAPPPPWRLTPFVAVGVPDGSLWSASTRRPDVSVLTDVAPTVLRLRGVRVPDDMVGQPIGSGPEPPDPGRLAELAARTESRDRVYVPAIMTFVIAQGVTYLVALWALRRPRMGDRRGQRWLGWIEWLAVAFAAFPVTTFWWRVLPVRLQEPWWAAVGYTVATAATAAVAMRFRRHPLSPLVAVAGMTTLVLAIDAATAGALQDLSLLGYTPVTAARFYGMGNMGFAVFGTAALLLAGAWVALGPSPRDGWWAASALLGVATVLEVAPTLGADFGGVLTFVPVFGGMLLVWAGVRFTWRRLVVALVLGVVAVAAVTWWEVRTGSETHLGRFVSGGPSEMWRVVARKAATNLRVMRITFWTWMVPIILTFIVGSLTLGGGWRRWFGGARQWRVTFVGMIAFGLIGGLVNDSGIVIPALSLVYVGAFLLMVQSRQPFGPYRLTEPVPTPGVGT